VSESADAGPEPGEPDDTNPVRRALDLFVFAPVGVVLTAAEDLPGMVAKGRQRVENQIRNAKVIGEFVVTQGQQDLSQRLGKLLHGEPAPPEVDAPVEGAGTSAPTADSASAADEERSEPPVEAARSEAQPKPAPDPADARIVEEALEGYDTLSASQVVRRLESLDADQLRAVHRHEASHRNRRTILNRTNQLLGAGPAEAS
jgi:hypothetical protein